jgi:hypothetical protein
MTRCGVPSALHCPPVLCPSVSLTMLLSSFKELQNAFSTHQDIIYVTLGALLVSIGLHYARKVNRVHDGEPPLLPGALPIFGHAFAFMRDSNKVFETAR